MSLGAIKRALTCATYPVTAMLARANLPRAPRFRGSYPDRATALAALPRNQQAGYDNEAIADVSFAAMCKVMLWDYPVLYWLRRLHQPGLRVLDAGGHMGTKYIAFRDHLEMAQLAWTVYDLPGIIRAARASQTAGTVPGEITFADDLAGAGPCDVFLASGLLQYADAPLATLLDALPERPQTVILNKVALTDGPARVTLERIGAIRVPYQTHTRSIFETSLKSAGYDIVDHWHIPTLSHRIPTHPWLPPSQSCGYVLRRRDSP